MKNLHEPPELGTVLLSFYECLTDASQLEVLMDMLTAWLDDEDVEIVGPKLDYHADQAWRLLGEISEPDYAETADLDALEVARMHDAAEVEASFKDQIRQEDCEKLREWLAADVEDSALLLRLFEDETTELVILSRDPKDGVFLAKRTGAQFQTVISKFVADSFELTHAEFTLVQELLLGGTLREISGRLGKSWETTRTQVKTLTNKLGVSSQADILRMVNQAATLMPSGQTKRPTSVSGGVKKVTRPDGRTIAYEVDGPAFEKTIVFVHGMTQGRHWPEKGRAYALSRGWRVVRISRAGRGASTLNPKEKDDLLQDHVADIMAVMNEEQIERFSIFSAADGFAIGYALGLQYPERLDTVVGLEIIPPILSRKVIDGFAGKMKTYGLACLYAPKTVKFMLGLAMHKIERMEDRYNVVHPLIGVELAKYEDADGLRADERNFNDIMLHKAEGMWRDASFSCHDWANTVPNANVRPKAALIHCGNSLNKSPGYLDAFAQHIGAPIYRLETYLPYVTSVLPTVLDAAEPL